MARAPLDHGHLGVGHELQHVPGLQTDVLDPLVAGHVIGHLAQRLPEIGVQLAGLVPQHEIFEGIEDRVPHPGDLIVVREHERQFLLEHENAGRYRRDDVPAVVHQLRQCGNVLLPGRGHRVQVPEFQFGHAAAAFPRGQGNRDPVVLEHLDQVLAEPRLVVVAVTGGEQHHPAAGRVGGLALRLGGHVAGHALSQRFALVGRQLRLAVHAEGLLQHHSHGFLPVRRIHQRGNHRPGHGAADQVGGAQQPVAGSGTALFVLDRLGPQHQVRKVHVPFVGRHVGTLGHEAHVAQVTVVHDLAVVRLVDAVDLHGFGFVDQIEQGRKGVTQAEAAPAAVADVEHAFELGIERLLVVELGVAPVDGVPLRRLQAALAPAFPDLIRHGVSATLRRRRARTRRFQN